MLNALWAKKPKIDEPDDIVPLQTHLFETADVARMLWDDWLPRVLQEQLDWNLFIFLSYAHDLGKASPVFQTKEDYNTFETDEKILNGLLRAGYVIKSYQMKKRTPHALVSFGILKRHGFKDSVSVIVGGHHGSPPTKNQIKDLETYKDNCGFDEDSWVQAQDALMEEALREAGLTKETALHKDIARPQQVLYSGLVILADWIASGKPEDKLPTMWIPNIPENIYGRRFEIDTPRPVQSKLLDAASLSLSPGIFIVEAPMGEGKTEAALAASEVLASKIGCRGVYFALPSQATSNAMLTRVKNWIQNFDGQDGSLSIRLAHGKADFNEEYEGIKLSAYHREADEEDAEGGAVFVDSWLVGRKKGILADFAIGTIDHVLMAGLQQKHLALRHLGLASKIVVIDECHAYDVYMESFLLTAVKWLGAYGVPIIVLSATLPTERRKSLIEAYFGKKQRNSRLSSKDGADWATSLAYPLITYTDGKDVKSLPIEARTAGRSKVVDVEMLVQDKVLEILATVLEDGGCAALIFNTVKNAQQAYEMIAEKFGHDIVEILHAGFIARDRTEREKHLLLKLGKDSAQRYKKHIVVGTQIFEQSLDIDFDVMFTQLCPMDLLLQRIGRLHRHDRISRPNGVKLPKCYVLDANWGSFDDGSKAVYGEYLLMRTCRVLEKWSSSISLPDDIPQLVAQVYNDDFDVGPPGEFVQEYEKARNDNDIRAKDRKRRAESYQIKGSLLDKNIIGWLETSYYDSEGEAAVRDGMDAIEVLVVQRRGGELCLLPWVENGELLTVYTPSDKMAKIIAGCSVRLPLLFSYDINQTIECIEVEMVLAGIVDSWYESYWLRGSLVLILDEDQNAVVDGHQLHYSKLTGLQVKNN
ncbi:MAG: CRISPR-associated helicase Cas3' [Eubacteriaceae bacterium]|nr:CRISPR-associated helicase Cas3' [Eubacteriaceae bacterium]